MFVFGRRPDGSLEPLTDTQLGQEVAGWVEAERGLGRDDGKIEGSLFALFHRSVHAVDDVTVTGSVIGLDFFK